jgi:CheY-like chemotaxis protein
VYLPALAQEAGAAPAREEPVPRGSEHVLLVEDEESLRLVLGEMLEGLGYRVTSCADGREALRRLVEDAAAFDLLLTDLTMPHLTGDVLAREALGVRPDLPVLLCTGYGERWTPESTRAAGACGLLLKPIALDQLARSVRAALDRRERG